MRDREGFRKILPREIVRAVGIGGLVASFFWGKALRDYNEQVNQQAALIYSATYPPQDDELPELPEFLKNKAWVVKDSLDSRRRERMTVIKKGVFDYPNDDEQLVLLFGLSGLMSVSAIVTLMLGLVIGAIKNESREKTKPSLSLPNAVRLLRPEWGDEPPNEEERKRLETAISFLPPVGGKVMMQRAIEDGRTHPMPLSPTLTAEEQVAYLIQNQQSLGERYIYQMTVQGLLPDRFKFAALALILTNPHQNDWS